MMDIETPLNYESLRTVLQHMDANLRFRLVSHIPSIRVVEKTVPLKIISLKGSHGLVINGTWYTIDIYQKSQIAEKPDRIVRKKCSRCNNDIDMYGFRDRSGSDALLPGDLVLRSDINHDDRINEADHGDEEMRRMENRLGEKEDRLTQLKSMVPLDSPDFDNPYETFAKSEVFSRSRRNFRSRIRYIEVTEEQLKQPDVVAALKIVISELGEQIQREKEELQPFYNRRDKIPSPYNNYIQLKITCNETDQPRIERVKYTAKLHNAQKSLLNFMFGNRNGPVHVKQLSVCWGYHFRFPQGLKLKIRQLAMWGKAETMFEDLKSIIDESSFPLDVLQIRSFRIATQDFLHPNVTSAKSLVIAGPKIDWLPIYNILQNKVVHKQYTYAPLSEDFYIFLVKYWLEVGRENGTCYTFGMINEEGIIKLLQSIAEQCDGAIQKDKSVMFSMNEFSKLAVSYEEIPENHEYIVPRYAGENYKEWIFKIAVTPLEPQELGIDNRFSSCNIL